MKLEQIIDPTNEDLYYLTKWRRKVHKLWRDNFYATRKSTRKWIKSVHKKGDLIYFILVRNRKIGQIGFQHINRKESSLYIGYVIRGRGKRDGAMTNAIYYLLGYAYAKGFKHIYLSVLKRNRQALRFYSKIGFSKIKQEGDSYIYKYGA